MGRILKVSVPGKIILSGEHAVVYGYPAIAAAIDKRLTVFSSGDHRTITSDIPIGCGMGSSAAFAVAISTAKTGNLNLEKINTLAYEIEKKLHGNPSGIDNTVVTYGGFLWYRKESESFRIFKQIPTKINLPEFYLLNSGKPAESTREMVEYVAKKYKKQKAQIVSVFKDIEITTKEILKYLVGDISSNFGKLIQENEKLLEMIGVVSASTKNLIRRIEKLGGYAKISGAGGISEGSGVILIYHKDIKKITLFGKESNLNLMPIKLGEEGVRIE